MALQPPSWTEAGGLLAQVFRWALRRLGMSDAPYLEIDVADPEKYPAVREAEGVDWIHLVVMNLGLPKAWRGKTRPAPGVRAKAHYLGKDAALYWQGHDGAVETVDIYRGDDRFIPFVFRGRGSEPRIAYLTDVYFLKHGSRAVPLAAGWHQFTVDAYYAPHERVTAQIEVNVPLSGHGPITARKVGRTIKR